MNINIHNFLRFFGVDTSLTPKALKKSLWLSAMRFLLHSGTVLGFTILISYFLSYYGTSQLPLLFVFISLGTLVGTFITNILIKKISVEQILRYALLLMSILIVSSFLSLEFLDHSLIRFISIVGILFSIGVTQLNILFSMYTESSFSPLESEEAFPIIEAGEPLGGLFSGVIAFIFSLYFAPQALLIAWSAIFFILFIIQYIKEWLSSESSFDKNNFVFLKSLYRKKSKKQSSVSNYYTLIRKNKLIISLLFFVILQSAGYIFIELIYSMSASVLFEHDHIPHSQVVQELAHGIGAFHVGTYGVLLILQLTVASKIQHTLGVINSIFLLPVVQIVSTFFTIISGSFFMGMSSKGVYEVAGGVSKNSYHSSFYVFSSHIREEVKELLDGLAKPIGMIISSFFAMIFSVLFFKIGFGFSEFYLFCSVMALLILGASLWFYSQMKKQYTEIALYNLQNETAIEEIFDAIEILSQNGHEKTIHILSKVLKEKNQAEIIQKKILEAFGDLQKDSAIPDLLWALQSENKEIQLSAVKALGKYKSLKKIMINHVFSRQKIISSLQKVFLHADSKKLRLEVIKVFKEMQHTEIASFLIESLSNSSPEKITEKHSRDRLFCSILGCSYFNDISIAYYVYPFLESKDSYLQSASIIALWQFHRYRDDLQKHLHIMLESNDPNMQMSAIYTIGELKLNIFLPNIKAIYEKSENLHVHKHCCIAFIKTGITQYIPHVLQMMFHEDNTISDSTKKLLYSPGIDNKTKEFIESFIRKKVIEKIKTILFENPHTLFEISSEKIENLMSLYSIIHEEKLVHTLQKILKERKLEEL